MTKQSKATDIRMVHQIHKVNQNPTASRFYTVNSANMYDTCISVYTSHNESNLVTFKECLKLKLR